MAGRLNVRRLQGFLSVLAGLAAMMGPVGAAHSETSYKVLHAFTNPGSAPGSPLVQSSDGNFYGVTASGGAAGRGTLYKMDATGALATIHSFDCPAEGCQPQAGLIRANDGSFYGVTGVGGAGGGSGTVFKMDAVGTFTVLHSFTCGADGCEPLGGLIQAGEGSLYGTTQAGGAGNGGTVFKMQASGTLTTVHSFSACINARPDGCQPTVILQAADGNLYGTTLAGGAVGCGTVFKIDPAGAFTTLHSFGGDSSGEGCVPNALIQASDGKFYGTTGTTAFKVDAAGTLVTLHTFAPCVSQPPEGCQPAGVIQASDGNFYGTTQGAGPAGGGTAFKMDATGAVTILHAFDCVTDGCNPAGPLVQAGDGSFYGATSSGAPGNAGSVFKLDGAGTLTTMHAFGSTAEGYSPARLVQAGDGSLYGTTVSGGAAGFGTVFEIASAGATATVHSFDCASEGCRPNSGLIQASDGSFYGTTAAGGAGTGGTVFKMDAAGNTTLLHAFDCVGEGCQPHAGLFQASDGSFYGTTTAGGAGSGGTVFKMDATGTVTVLHSFDSPSTEGWRPGTLIQAADGNFYGATSSGAVPTAGAIFKMDAAGMVTILHSFACSHSEECRLFSTTLLQASDGNFYGTTSAGAVSDAGISFRIDSAGTFTVLHSFACDTEGCQPTSLIQATDGNFYGTTQSGAEANQGTIFQMDTTGNVTTLHSFACSTDGCQANSLIEATDGSLYGTAIGGPAGGGVVFRLTPGDPIVPVTAALTALGPAEVWIAPAKVRLGLDLLTQVFVNSAKAGEGRLHNVTMGGPRSVDAVLYRIPLALTAGPVDFPAGATLEVTVSARRACPGWSTHNGGKVGLWYNGPPTDGGGDAGSRFGATIGGTTTAYFLRDGFGLSAQPGSLGELADVTIRGKVRCSAFTPFGSWRITP